MLIRTMLCKTGRNTLCRAAAAIVACGVAMTAPALAQPDTSTSASAQTITTYTNPLPVTIADPFVLKEGDTYYMYGTTDNADGLGFEVYKSTDMVRWLRAGKIYSPNRSSFGRINFWAPEVIKKDGYFYLHYTALSPNEKRRNICIARSKSPEGPFEDYSGPLFPGSVIDSHIYEDEDTGELFIYASPENETESKILGARLSSDLKKLETSPTVCLTAEFGWEDLWIEGPIIHKHKGTLYMLYSGGAWWETEYALGYATAQSALGPWKKHDKPVLTKTDAVPGPGHNGLATSPDGSELFVVYHAHAGDYTVSRVAAMDRIVFEPAESGPDLLTMPGAPTSSPQPLPSGAKPMAAAQSDDFSGSEVNLDLWNVYMNYPDEHKQEDGTLNITSVDGDFWRTHDNGHNVFLQPIPTGDFAIETSVTMESEETNEQAFLTLFLNEDNHITLAGVHLIGPRIAVTHEVKGKPDVSLSPNTIGWPLCLRIEKRGNSVKFFASADGKDWQPVRRDVEIRNWEPRYIGIGAWSPGVERTIEARFDYFNVVPLN